MPAIWNRASPSIARAYCNYLDDPPSRPGRPMRRSSNNEARRRHCRCCLTHAGVAGWQLARSIHGLCARGTTTKGSIHTYVSASSSLLCRRVCAVVVFSTCVLGVYVPPGRPLPTGPGSVVVHLLHPSPLVTLIDHHPQIDPELAGIPLT
jgi:hypothetical protein